MILREAIKDDLPAVVTLCRRTWMAIGLPHDITVARLEGRLPRLRLVVLYEGKDLLAVLGAVPGSFEGRPAFSAGLLAVDQKRKDKLDILDAIVLYGLNIALAEGRAAIVSRRDKRTTSAPYGVDLLGMAVSGDATTDYHQEGAAQEMAELILKRHPEWLTSL